MIIWKWPIEVTDTQVIDVPNGARFLDVQMQGEHCCVWALCDQHAPRSERHIAIYGTGNPMPDAPGEYIATFQMAGGALVFHAFEIAV